MGNKKSRMAREAKEAKQDSERFKDSLAVVITFWLEMGNTPDKRDAMVNKFLENMFTTHPEYEPLFKHRSQFAGMLNKMFTTLVNLLATSKHDEAMEMIDSLGTRHRHFGVPASAFSHWMATFEKAIQEFFPDIFTARRQFCFSATLHYVASKMIQAAELEEDGIYTTGDYKPKYPENYFDDLDVEDWKSFSSNELCLQYLHLHLVKYLSSEMSLFLREVHEYRKQPTKEKYSDIYRTYIAEDGPIAVNVNHQIRAEVKSAFEEQGCTANVFDLVVHEMGYLIQRNSHLWEKFRESNLWAAMLSSIEGHTKHAKRVSRSKSGKV